MSLICCHWHCYSCCPLPTTNNTDTNKLVIVSGVALYYGDNYLIAVLKFVAVQITQWPRDHTAKAVLWLHDLENDKHLSLYYSSIVVEQQVSHTYFLGIWHHNKLSCKCSVWCLGTWECDHPLCTVASNLYHASYPDPTHGVWARD